MALDLNLYERIRVMYEQEHLSIREIALKLHIARDTVSKYCNGKTVPHEF